MPLPEVVFWVQWLPTGFPVPVMGTTDLNLYVQLPGQTNLAVVPRSRLGAEWLPL